MKSETNIYQLNNHETIWTRLGSDVSVAADVHDALVLSGLMWPISSHGVFTMIKKEIYPISDAQAIVRDDNKERLFVLNGSSDVFQNEYIFEFVDDLIKDKRFELFRAGELHKGQKVWFLLKINSEISINSDDYCPYLLVLNTHDHSKRFTIQMIWERDISKTILPLCIPEALCTLQPRKVDALKIESLNIIELFVNNKKSLKEAFSKLHYEPLADKDAIRLIERVIRGPKSHPRTQNIKSSIFKAFKRGQGNEGKTKLDFLNGVAEFVDHCRQTRVEEGRFEQELRFESLTVGSGAVLKQKVFDMLIK